MATREILRDSCWLVTAHQTTLKFRSGQAGFLNITRDVQRVVADSRISIGLCTVFVQHTSASLVIQENADPAVLRDLEAWMRDMVSESRGWEHDEEGADDMPAHVRSALTKTSESIPVHDGRLVLGIWQALYLWEHRRRSHTRSVVVHVQG